MRRIYIHEKIQNISKIEEGTLLFSGMEEAEALIRVWVLRFLSDVKVLNYLFYKEKHILDTALAYFGMAENEDKEEIEEIVHTLRQTYEKKEHILPPTLQKNLDKFATVIPLLPEEKMLLAFFALLRANEMLDDIFNSIEMNFNTLKRYLSLMFQIEKSRIDKILSKNGSLIANGILKQNLHGTTTMRHFFDFLFGAEKLLYHESEDILDIFQEYFKPVGNSKLRLQDYYHMQEFVTLFLSLLKRKKSLNIMLYGKPGTGKTELAKLLAQTAGYKLYEVSYLDGDGEPLSSHRRINALNAANKILGSDCMILFDEFEDMAETGLFGIKIFEHKAWLNRFLENSKRPIIWISNSISFLDEAMLRRFDVVLEMPTLPIKKRFAFIKKRFANILDENMIGNIAQNRAISLGVVDSIATLIQKSGSGDKALTHKLINEMLKAQGYEEISDITSQGIDYSLKYINTDYDLEEVAKRVEAVGSARICIYGVPGTGKSEFARFLSDRLHKPLIKKRGSDLLSMWVGGTERNIKNAFKEAQQDGAILLFDEVDSFLADRTHAQRNWEVTQVNEMLTQMESFEGIFIATTNLVDTLDSASLRRFDLKMEFKPLRIDQITALFQIYCNSFSILYEEMPLSKLSGICIGDFANIAKQHRLSPMKSAQELYEQLLQELTLKTKEHKLGLL